jgi:hypothetical protein
LVLLNIGDYQSSQALSEEAIKIFERKLKPLTQVDNDNSNSGMASVSKVENSLVELNNSLNNKALPEDLMKMVHTQVHPNLQIAFDLTLKR